MSARTLAVAAFIKLSTILVLQDPVEGPTFFPKLTGPKISRTVGVDCGETCSKEGDVTKELWHATNEEAARAIKACDRFEPGKEGKVGGAIYFGDSKLDAMMRSVQGNGAVVKATVHLGCIKEITEIKEGHVWGPRSIKKNRAKLAELGCDSIRIAYPAAGIEYVIYDPSQATDIEVFTVVKGSQDLRPL